MIRSCLFALIVYLGVGAGVEAQSTACSGMEESQGCIQGIKNAVRDRNRFWFGTWYTSNCPAGSPQLFCMAKSPQIPAGSSVQSILAQGGVVGDASIDRFLTVSYTSPAGTYSGCDTSVTMEATAFMPDPLSDTTYGAWTARIRPNISWDTKSEMVKYTLVMLDVGAGFLHALWANIEGGSLPGGTTDLPSNINVYPFIPSGMPFYEAGNVYAFFLFKQSSLDDITVDTSNFSVLFDFQLNLASFMAEHQLTGPVAVNWVLVHGDVYASQRFSDRGGLYNCPSFVKRETLNAPHNMRPFLPPTTDYSVFIHAKITTTELDYCLCNESYTAPATVYTIDAIGNPTLNASGTRHDEGSSWRISFEKRGLAAMSTNFTGEWHTLLLVDPDVPFATAGTNAKPILHMMVTNIKDGVFTSGDFLQPYRGPRPPDAPHFYYFLLYKQPQEFTFTYDYVNQTFIGSPTCERCLFDVSSFVSANNLDLVGVTWMNVTLDPWIQYSYIKGGRNASMYCSDVPGWDPDVPCGSVRLEFSMLLVGLLSILAARFVV